MKKKSQSQVLNEKDLLESKVQPERRDSIDTVNMTRSDSYDKPKENSVRLGICAMVK